MFKLVLRGFVQRKLRVLLTAIAIALGVALMAGTYILTDTINHAFAEVFATAYANKAVVVTEKETLGGSEVSVLNRATLARVRAVPGVAAAAGAISSQAALLTTGGKRLTGGGAPGRVDALQPPRFEAFTATQGHLPRAADEVAIDQASAKRNHLRLGQQIVIAGRLAGAALHARGHREVRGQRILRRHHRRAPDPQPGTVRRGRTGRLRQHQRRRRPRHRTHGTGRPHPRRRCRRR